MKKYLIIFIIGVVIAAAGFFLASRINKKDTQMVAENQTKPVILEEVPIETQKNHEEKNKQVQEFQKENITQKSKQEVPFIVQAPFGNWNDPNFQNACEEASIVMATGWVKGEKIISPKESKKRIMDIIIFENKTLGYSTDTDTSDMERIFREYFKYENITAKENVTLEDLKSEIQKENLLIVPVFGQALGNPNFTHPGPVAHMLVIIGFDPLTKQFITNDPGTRNGADYKYDELLLFDAIWEYPSGKKSSLPPVGILKKNILVVSKLK